MNRATVWLKSWFVFNRNIVAKYSVQNIRCNLEKLLKIVSRETSFHPENLTAYCTVSRDFEIALFIPSQLEQMRCPG